MLTTHGQIARDRLRYTYGVEPYGDGLMVWIEWRLREPHDPACVICAQLAPEHRRCAGDGALIVRRDQHGILFETPDDAVDMVAAIVQGT